MRLWISLLALLAPAAVCAGVNEWINVGPEGGRVASIVVDPQDAATVYAGTSAGLFKSTDNGQSWSNSGLIGWGVERLVIDPQTPATLYAVAVGDDDSGVTKQFKSLDGGQSWTEQGYCCVVAVDPKNTSTLYALAG